MIKNKKIFLIILIALLCLILLSYLFINNTGNINSNTIDVISNTDNKIVAYNSLDTKIIDNKKTLFDKGFNKEFNYTDHDSRCATLPKAIDPSDDALIKLTKECFRDEPSKKVYIKLPPFTMPDVSWKDKTLLIHGKKITYKFGEGNPAEVALGINDYNGKNGVYQDYVTPEVERNLYAFLSDPLLKDLVDRCGTLLGKDKVDTSLPLIQNLPAVLDTKELSLENMLRIDVETGRKIIDYDRMIALDSVFERLLGYGFSVKESDKLKHQCYIEKDLISFEKINAKFTVAIKPYVNGP